MKKIIILFSLSLVLAGGVFYQLTREEESVSPHALPSPHIAEEETLFFTNLDLETLTGWTLQSHTERLSVEKNIENAENIENVDNVESVEDIGTDTDINIGSAAESQAETNASPPSTWTFSYTTLSPLIKNQGRENQGRKTLLENFPAGEAEALANARNFLSLAYVNEDTADLSPLKALSGKKNLSPNDPNLAGQTFYTLTWTSLGESNTNIEPATSSSGEPTQEPTTSARESVTEVFIEGEAAAPLRKLYYGGKAYWVREWYILALKRSPDEMYPKDFLSLSAHTLERVEQKVLNGTGTSTPNSNSDPNTIDNSTNGFALALTAPYTWSLLPPSAAAGNSGETADAEATQKEEVTTKINAFIETLLFLNAESALLLHLDEEIHQLKSTAHTTIMFTLTSRRPAPASPRQEILTLYAHRDHLYATVSTYPDIFYRLPAQKSLSALQYSYEDFLP